MPGGILNGFKSFVDKVVPKNLPIPGLANSNEEEEDKDKYDKDLHLYNREGFFYVLIIDNNINDLEHEQTIAEEAGFSFRHLQGAAVQLPQGRRVFSVMRRRNREAGEPAFKGPGFRFRPRNRFLPQSGRKIRQGRTDPFRGSVPGDRFLNGDDQINGVYYH